MPWRVGTFGFRAPYAAKCLGDMNGQWVRITQSQSDRMNIPTTMGRASALIATADPRLGSWSINMSKRKDFAVCGDCMGPIDLDKILPLVRRNLRVTHSCGKVLNRGKDAAR
jgi:hypothetical protein